MSEPYPPRKWPDPQHELHGLHSYRPGNSPVGLPQNLYAVTAIDKITDLVLDDLPEEVAAYHGYPREQYDVARHHARVILGDLLYDEALAEDSRLPESQTRAVGERSLRLASVG